MLQVNRYRGQLQREIVAIKGKGKGKVAVAMKTLPVGCKYNGPIYG